MQPFFQAKKHPEIGVRPFVGADDDGRIGICYHHYESGENQGPIAEVPDNLVRSFRGMQLIDACLDAQVELNDKLLEDAWQAGDPNVQVAAIDDVLGEMRADLLESGLPDLDPALEYLWENDIYVATAPIYTAVMNGHLEPTEVLRNVLTYTLLLVKGELHDDAGKLYDDISQERQNYSRRCLNDMMACLEAFMKESFDEIQESFHQISSAMPKPKKPEPEPEPKKKSKGFFDTITRSIRRSDLKIDKDDTTPLYSKLHEVEYKTRETITGLSRNWNNHQQGIHPDVRYCSYHENFRALGTTLHQFLELTQYVSVKDKVNRDELLFIRNRIHDLTVYLHVQLLQYVPRMYRLTL